MNAPAFGRDVAPLGREVGATGFARGAPLKQGWEGLKNCRINVLI